MNEYEMTYIQRIGLGAETIERLQKRVARSFEKHGGEVLRVLDMGEKTLAYKIDKEARGHYFVMNLLGQGPLVDEIETLFRISPEILRFLTVRLAKGVDVDQKKEEYQEKESTPGKESEAAPLEERDS